MADSKSTMHNVSKDTSDNDKAVSAPHKMHDASLIDSSCDDASFKSGFVTLVGRPNAGKSTLINRIVGHKVAITSSTAQTTRHRFRAVLTDPKFQMIMVDTPGLHKPHDALGEELNASALEALKGVDAIAFVLDASKPFGRGDAWVVKQLASIGTRLILVISKTDLADKKTIDEQVIAASEHANWSDCVALSAQEDEGVDDFVEAVVDGLPHGPHWFPSDMDTDQPFEVLVAEFIREKILRDFRDEIPHSIGVAVDDSSLDHHKNLYRIYATIYVERDSQKGIIIGSGGSALRRVGSEARLDLEQLLGCHVFLDLHVKVRRNWRRDLNQIRRFGYGEGI